MSNRHLMIDIETLSSTNDAAIIAIGACIFNRVDITDTHQWLISPEWAIGHRSQRTKDDFWSNPEKVAPEVQQRMFSGTKMPWDVADEFRQWVEFYSELNGAWANPPQFDYVILRSMFESLELPFPIHYRLERDCRTVFGVARSLGLDLQSAYGDREEHDALSDAVAQARAIQLIWDRLY